jgi:hypothetical protein
MPPKLPPLPIPVVARPFQAAAQELPNHFDAPITNRVLIENVGSNGDLDLRQIEKASFQFCEGSGGADRDGIHQYFYNFSIFFSIFFLSFF